jgi:hypothetical protein
MVKQDKFNKFYIIYLWTLFIILIGIWMIGVITIPQSVQAQDVIETKEADQLCKALRDENTQLRLELQNLKDEKFSASFLSCKKFCGR